jgi:phosphopantetheinyl transferase
LRAAFSEREAKVLQALDDEALFLRWTAKEAYLKTIGQGFHESLKKIEILDGTIFHGRRPVAGLTLQSGFPCPGYAFSLVY